MNAPSMALPLIFVLTGLAALATGIVWLLMRPAILAQYHYNQYVIAATHLVVLGWICSVVMGAMYQLVPVALETKLYSERLAKVQMAFHVVGFVGMVWMFRVWNMKQVGHFGIGLAIGVILFVYNIARTLRCVPKWNVTATAVAAALFWISMTITAGLFIAAGKCSYDSTDGVASEEGVRTLVSAVQSAAGFALRFDAISAMHAHAHLGGVGFFTMLIVGVSYKLIPMFTLSEVQSHRRAGWSV
ncbi:MAG TPA: cbb3-type cytochrome c oxidase subunit I, partial [Candidatus Paceibacterota bacterium]|nr:cbb3-type cytochrome c oxidase subunit I [Candidatus Paceibacterota bacterium]